MKEIRCNTCKKKLMNADLIQGRVEIKCPKCKEITIISKPFQDRVKLVKK